MFELAISTLLLIGFLVVGLKVLGSFDAAYYAMGQNVDRTLAQEAYLRLGGVICGLIALFSVSRNNKIAACVLIILSAFQIPFFIAHLLFRRRFHALEQEELLRKAKRNYAQKSYAEAEQIYRDVLAKQDAQYFAPDIKTKWQLGNSLIEQRKFDEGIELYRAVIENEKISNPASPALAGHCQNLAWAFDKSNRFLEAKKSYQEVLALNAKNDQLNSWFTLVCRKQLAKILLNLGETSEAKIQEDEAEAILRRHGWTYPECPETD